MSEEYKSLKELYELLPKIRQEGRGKISIPKCLILMCGKIQKMKIHIEKWMNKYVTRCLSK